MSKRKYPSELSTRTVRVRLADWQLLLEISRRAGVNVAEALHKLITRQDETDKPAVKRQDQIPVIAARSRPAIVIKPRGGKIYV